MPQANREVGECTEVHRPTWDLFLMEKKDYGSQGENVEDVNVVVSPFRPWMGEVQREIRTVRRKNSGGNEVLQDANTLLSGQPLFV